MEKRAKQIKADIEKVINDISMTDRQSFCSNVRYAKGEINHDVLIKTLTGMQKYREKLFAELNELSKDYEKRGYTAEVDWQK